MNQNHDDHNMALELLAGRIRELDRKINFARGMQRPYAALEGLRASLKRDVERITVGATTGQSLHVTLHPPSKDDEL